MLDELAEPNKGKVRLLSRADEKRYSKGNRDGPRHRAERVAIVNGFDFAHYPPCDHKVPGLAFGAAGLEKFGP